MEPIIIPQPQPFKDPSIVPYNQADKAHERLGDYLRSAADCKSKRDYNGAASYYDECRTTIISMEELTPSEEKSLKDAKLMVYSIFTEHNNNCLPKFPGEKPKLCDHQDKLFFACSDYSEALARVCQAHHFMMPASADPRKAFIAND